MTAIAFCDRFFRMTLNTIASSTITICTSFFNLRLNIREHIYIYIFFYLRIKSLSISPVGILLATRSLLRAFTFVKKLPSILIILKGYYFMKKKVKFFCTIHKSFETFFFYSVVIMNCIDRFANIEKVLCVVYILLDLLGNIYL